VAPCSTDGVEGYGPASYGEAFADVYDRWYADVSDVDSTVAFIAALAAGGPVLELGVGTGRLALPLAARAVPMTGIDTSARMVARLREKAGGDRVDVAVGDMSRDEDVPTGPFAVVFVAYNTIFNLLEPGAQERCFQVVASRLEPAGAFVVEAFVPDEAQPAGAHVEVRSMTADSVVLSVNRHDPAGRRIEGQFVELTEAGGVHLRPWAIHYSSPDQLDAMASATGLVLAERSADWMQTPFTAASTHHVSVYRRSDLGRA